MKADKIREYYLLKLKEAEENFMRADCDSERDNWRRIVLGYQYLVDLPRYDSRDENLSRLAR